MTENSFKRTIDNTAWLETNLSQTLPAFRVVHFETSSLEASLDHLLTDILNHPKLKNWVSVPRPLEVLKNLMTAIVSRRRAWVYGEDAQYEVHPIRITPVVTFNMELDERTAFWEVVENDAVLNERVNLFVRELIAFVTSHMSKNTYAIHDLAYDNRTRRWSISEHADWRAIQWTKDQVRLLDEKHEDI